MEDEKACVVEKTSSTSIASDIKNLEIASQKSEIEKISKNDELHTQSSESCKEIIITSDVQLPMETDKVQESPKTSSSESSESTSTDSSSSQEEQQPKTRKRKRRRRRKKKAVAIAAYIPDEPFTKRYKKTFVEISMKPKLHVKFDDSGNVVSYQNNYKPRIVNTRPVNLSITEDLVEKKTERINVPNKEETKTDSPEETLTISLKPRIIKAIGT